MLCTTVRVLTCVSFDFYLSEPKFTSSASQKNLLSATLEVALGKNVFALTSTPARCGFSHQKQKHFIIHQSAQVGKEHSILHRLEIIGKGKPRSPIPTRKKKRFFIFFSSNNFLGCLPCKLHVLMTEKLKCLLTSVCCSVKTQAPFLEKDKVAIPHMEEQVERSALTYFCDVSLGQYLVRHSSHMPSCKYVDKDKHITSDHSSEM